MPATVAKSSARELRQRAERHRLLARRITDERAAQALWCAALREAALADEMERPGGCDRSGTKRLSR
jgi:hypothetical protein